MAVPAGWRLAPPLSYVQTAQHAYAAGFRDEPGAIIVAIAMAESSLIPNNRNVNRNKSVDRGILQINTIHTQVTDAQADDPAAAFRFGWQLSLGGTKFTDWYQFRDRNHEPFLPAARQAMAQVQGSPTTPASGGLPPAPRTTANIASRDIPAGLADAPGIPLTARDVRIMGQRLPAVEPARYITAATLELSVDEVSQLTLTIADPAGARDAGVYFLHGTPIDLGELRFVVTGVEWGPGSDALEELTVTCLSAPAERLRMADPLGEADTWEHVSATNLLGSFAYDVKLAYVGESGPVYPSITREGVAEDDPQFFGGRVVNRAQSNYELGLDLARREGKWFFEAGGWLYFGRPTWLLARLTQFAVRWRHGPASGHLTPLEAPICGRDADDAHPQRAPGPRHIAVQLPRGLADRIRPGMAMHYDGTPGWETSAFTADALAPAGYLVTAVTVDLLDPGAPIRVDAREAIDPIPEPDEDDVAAVDDAASTATPDGPPTGRSGAGPTALAFVDLCLKQVGDRYEYGAEVSLTDPDPDVFDCSELIQWACARLGVTFVDGSSAQIAAAERAGLVIPMAKAATTRGAILWTPGHIAVSLGDNRTTVEARGRAYGVVRGPFTLTRFKKAAKIPGLDYGTATTFLNPFD